MTPLVIWFNHWFSTAYHIINLMRSGTKRELHVIGSNRNAEAVIQLACDEWYTEPSVMSDEEYLRYCLDFCREHSVEVFAPRRGMAVISRNARLFSEIGVKLLLDIKSEAVEIFRDKISTYEFLKEAVSECIPMYRAVNNSEEFDAAYTEITACHERAVFKYACDEGAVSFRVIDNSIEGENALSIAPGMKLTYEAAQRIITGSGLRSRLLMMPYLKEVEISADCLATPRGNIIIPRYKSNGRIYTIKHDPEIVSLCSRILDAAKLEMPCNIQFKCDGGKPYLLEINTRMSGGVQLSCIGTGVNIPALALAKLLGEDMEWHMDNEETKVSYIESPVKLPAKETQTV